MPDVTRTPAQAGIPLHSVETPALLLDLDSVEHNLSIVHGRTEKAGVRVRPHAKAHKCPDLARLQVLAGARGICCQKLSEAEVFAQQGFDDILVTNQLVGHDKVSRAAELSRTITLAVCVDDPIQVDELVSAAKSRDARLGVFVEIDVGQSRCGVGSPEEAVRLARRIAECEPYLRFKGLHAFNGKAQHTRTPSDRLQLLNLARTFIQDTKSLLEVAGIECETVTGGGTGTWHSDMLSGAYDEVQPGSYVLMDTDYGENVCANDEDVLKAALFGWVTVISRRKNRAVLDGGLKSFATDRGFPRVLAAGWQVTAMSDEHTVIERQDGQGMEIRLGDKLLLQPSHCDPTVNLHDWMVAMRGDRVEAVWAVAARGAVL